MKLKENLFIDLIKKNKLMKKYLINIFSLITIKAAENGAVYLAYNLYIYMIYGNYDLNINKSNILIRLFNDINSIKLNEKVVPKKTFVVISKIINYFFGDLGGDLLIVNENNISKIVNIYGNYKSDYKEKIEETIMKKNNYLDYFILLFEKENIGLTENILINSNMEFYDINPDFKYLEIKKDISETYLDSDNRMNQNVEGIRKISSFDDLKKLLPSYYAFFERGNEEIFNYLLARNEFLTFNYSGQLEENKNIKINLYFDVTEDNFISIGEKKFFSITLFKEIFLFIVYNLINEFFYNKLLINNNVKFVLNIHSGKFEITEFNYMKSYEDFKNNFLIEYVPDFFVLEIDKDMMYFDNSKYNININILFTDLEKKNIYYEQLMIKKGFNNYNMMIAVENKKNIEVNIDNFLNLEIYRLFNFKKKLFNTGDLVNLKELILRVLNFVTLNIIENR
ncbi:hypothetical protein [Marinitoga sp. 1155]|uniref:hypothetical protein n=1 Tax=Marinitoga sp. 1155 TaxID=1428448 RepID=UPI0006418256|nr:hypothetical protein [Marinitoga sp. 1155]KLO23512.1 hypothetical protein X274_06390 [Marinitoga sp. 1155]